MDSCVDAHAAGRDERWAVDRVIPCAMGIQRAKRHANLHLSQKILLLLLLLLQSLLQRMRFATARLSKTKD